jgi:hypothetical protein
MQPSKRPRGRPKKKRKIRNLCERSQAPSPSPSHVMHSDADVESSDAAAPQVDDAAAPQVDTGRAPQVDASAPPADAAVNLSDVEVDQGDVSEPEEWWDSNAGMKPTRSDSNASDGSSDVGDLDMLPEESDVEIQGAMVDLMVELEDCDPRDFEWLPPRERKRVVPKTIGVISLKARVVRELTMGSRKAEGALLWPRCPCKVGAHTAAPQARLCNEKSNKTHRSMAQASATLTPGILVPFPFLPDIAICIRVVVVCCVPGHVGCIVHHVVLSTVQSLVRGAFAESLAIRSSRKLTLFLTGSIARPPAFKTAKADTCGSEWDGKRSGVESE